MQEEEIFIDIKNFEGKYQISNLGNVKSLCWGKERILKNKYDKDCYTYVNLYNNELKKNTYKTSHRLVAENFISNPDNKSCVDHIDGDITNNNLKNLRWATRAENAFNTKKQTRNKSGYKGVIRIKSSNKFKAAIKKGNDYFYLGVFASAKEAGDAYDTKAKELFGDFYRPVDLTFNGDEL